MTNEEKANTVADYDYRRGMSNNAVDAYRRNEKPISRSTAQDIRDADNEPDERKAQNSSDGR